MVARQWQGRIADPGPDGLRDRRDRLAVRIARLQGEGATPTGPHPAFAPDYRAARSRFRDAAERAGARLEAQRLPGQEGPDGAPLYMDRAWIGPVSAAVAVLTLSGPPGAATLTGSADRSGRPR